jgi:hypothetical protein
VSSLNTPSGLRRLSPHSLEDLAAAADALEGVRRRDIAPGDRLLVATRNSIYSMTANADGSFLAAGGWFARTGAGPSIVGVCGCTAGGRALFTEIVAAPGLFLEFDNGLQTTRIQRVRLLRIGGRKAPESRGALQEAEP